MNLVKIGVSGIQDEIYFWNSSFVCYMLGANPPVHVMDGLFRRIWRNFGIDKVVMVRKGLFMIRFHAMDMRDKVLGGSYFFDQTPVIMKEWTQDMNLKKMEVSSVPIWIQVRIGLKYWGEKSLFKIVAQIRQPVQCDEATTKRHKVQFARVMVRVQINQQLPTSLSFLDEKGLKQEVFVSYEWKPSQCRNCMNLAMNQRIVEFNRPRRFGLKR